MAMYTHMIRDKWAFGYCWVGPEPPATSWQRTGRNTNWVALVSEDGDFINSATVRALCKALERVEHGVS